MEQMKTRAYQQFRVWIVLYSRIEKHIPNSRLGQPEMVRAGDDLEFAASKRVPCRNKSFDSE